MICERCGRLRNRATGRCVCDDFAGAAPPPVALTHPPAGTPAPSPSPLAPAPSPVPEEGAGGSSPATDVPPISRAAAVAVLDLSDRPARPASPPVSVAPPPPPPRVRVPGEAIGVLRRVRLGRRGRVDVVAYDGRLVLARPGAPTNLLAPQLAAQDPTSRVIDDGAVDEASIWEDRLGGRAALDLRHGEQLVLTWSAHRNPRVDGEDLLTSAFPGKVDQGPSHALSRVLRLVALVTVAVLVGLGAWRGLTLLLRPDPPPPAAPAPPPTLAPDEQAARDALAPACERWAAFATSVVRGDRPDPRVAGEVADVVRPAFDAAAAAPAYVAARDEVVYLQGYGRRPPAEIARESSSRVAYALDTVSTACARAAAAPSP